MVGQVVTYTDNRGQQFPALVHAVNPTSEKHLTLLLADGSKLVDVTHISIALKDGDKPVKCWEEMVEVEIDLNKLPKVNVPVAVHKPFNPKQIAKVCHEVNRAYCKSIGDDSQPAWEDAPNWQKASAINGVTFHQEALAKGEEPSPSASHDAWLKQKEAEGWKYGPVKDPEAKEHPCFVPYEELPVEQRAKDYIFAAVVKQLTVSDTAENAV